MYCANSYYSSDSTITVLDGTSDSILRRIRVGGTPLALAGNAASNKVYATVYDDPAVVVINASTDSVEARVLAAQFIGQLLYVDRESLLCCIGNADSVALIDGVTNQVVALVPVSGRPYSMLYNPVSNKLYTANSNAGNLTVIDLATLQSLALPSVGRWPSSLAFDSVANRVYCLSGSDSVVTVIDGRGDSVIGSVGIGRGASQTAWAGPSRRLYVSHPSTSMVTMIRDTSEVGVADAGSRSGRRLEATIVRGVLFLGAGQASGHDPNSPSGIGSCPCKPVLLDISGRKVLDLVPGANDVSALAPGVYFVRSTQGIRKVVLAK